MFISKQDFDRLLVIVYGVETGHSTAGEMEEAVGILRTERNFLITEGIRRHKTSEETEALSSEGIEVEERPKWQN